MKDLVKLLGLDNPYETETIHVFSMGMYGLFNKYTNEYIPGNNNNNYTAKNIELGEDELLIPFCATNDIVEHDAYFGRKTLDMISSVDVTYLKKCEMQINGNIILNISSTDLQYVNSILNKPIINFLTIYEASQITIQESKFILDIKPIVKFPVSVSYRGEDPSYTLFITYDPMGSVEFYRGTRI